MTRFDAQVANCFHSSTINSSPDSSDDAMSTIFHEASDESSTYALIAIILGAMLIAVLALFSYCYCCTPRAG